MSNTTHRTAVPDDGQQTEGGTMIRQYLNTHKRLWLAPILIVLSLTTILLFMDALRIGDGTIPSDAPVKEWAR